MGDSPQLLEIADRILASFSPLLSLAPEELDRVGVSVLIPIFKEEEFSEIVARTGKAFFMQTTLIMINVPTYVVGDLHGNVFDLIRILVLIGLPPMSRVLLLGDYVDRWQYSVEAIGLLFALVSQFPEYVAVLRGNHEFAKANAAYGFKAEVTELYSTGAT
jgi:protein phosphatase